MTALAVTNTLVSNTPIYASLFNTNYSDIVNYVNARNSGATQWDALSVLGATALASTLTVTGATTLTGGVVNLFGYRKPNLVYASATEIDVENNTGTANQTTIVFPDGTVRSVTEDTSSTHKYRRFLITATAEYTTGTEDSGLYTGLAEATNTWYAIYAVKSLIDATKFVLVGTTTLPVQGSFATLNTNLGTNSWVYLGLIRNGNNDGETGDILPFLQRGPRTSFSAAPSGGDSFGLTVASGSGATSLTYTHSAGTGATDVPSVVAIGDLSILVTGATSVENNVQDAAGTTTIGLLTSPGIALILPDLALSAGLKVTRASGNIVTGRYVLLSYHDTVLSAGINPIV